jgi:hypothetical protein
MNHILLFVILKNKSSTLLFFLIDKITMNLNKFIINIKDELSNNNIFHL